MAAEHPGVAHRVRPVPIWVTVLAVALGLFASVIGLSAIISPSNALGYVPGADDIARTWGGRNLGLGVVLLTAALLRSPVGYVVAFAGQVCRELGDLVGALPNTSGVLITCAFLAVDLIGLAGSLLSWRRQRIGAGLLTQDLVHLGSGEPGAEELPRRRTS